MSPGSESGELSIFMETFCRTGAAAIRNYVMLSGEHYSTMPEYFLGSSLFSTPSNGRAFTLETPLWQIHAWLKGRSTVPAMNPELSRWKIDLIVYDGLKPSPGEQLIWALVEVKNGYIDADPIVGRRTDRDKLLMIANWFGTSVPHLICCGSLSPDRRTYHIERAKHQGDLWFDAPTGKLPVDEETAYFGVRVIRSPLGL